MSGLGNLSRSLQSSAQAESQSELFYIRVMYNEKNPDEVARLDKVREGVTLIADALGTKLSERSYRYTSGETERVFSA